MKGLLASVSLLGLLMSVFWLDPEREGGNNLLPLLCLFWVLMPSRGFQHYELILQIPSHWQLWVQPVTGVDTDLATVILPSSHRLLLPGPTALSLKSPVFLGFCSGFLFVCESSCSVSLADSTWLLELEKLRVLVLPLPSFKDVVTLIFNLFNQFLM